ncbi:unnamed protein product, partial [Darwinula stevensoni]
GRLPHRPRLGPAEGGGREAVHRDEPGAARRGARREAQASGSQPRFVFATGGDGPTGILRRDHLLRGQGEAVPRGPGRGADGRAALRPHASQAGEGEADPRGLAGPGRDVPAGHGGRGRTAQRRQEAPQGHAEAQPPALRMGFVEKSSPKNFHC